MPGAMNSAKLRAVNKSNDSTIPKSTPSEKMIFLPFKRQLPAQKTSIEIVVISICILMVISVK